ncbi:uncharacterized protein LOC129590706 [Paramacrobiotus metropolitanus]|uniref:uncharacterized protein LOC129590706 n=1 Tax=Paramacrobiotus metropolitanus TaxID=2943436 RepID=UPI002446232F|nr:uncharacterized protein LOC129590706 [Paramacrobiotus metropolitanus]
MQRTRSTESEEESDQLFWNYMHGCMDLDVEEVDSGQNQLTQKSPQLKVCEAMTPVLGRGILKAEGLQTEAKSGTDAADVGTLSKEYEEQCERSQRLSDAKLRSAGVGRGRSRIGPSESGMNPTPNPVKPPKNVTLVGVSGTNTAPRSRFAILNKEIEKQFTAPTVKERDEHGLAHQKTAAPVRVVNNILTTKTLFKNVRVLDRMDQITLIRGGLSAVKQELMKPSMGEYDHQNTSRPCVLGLMRDIMLEQADDAHVLQECTQLLERGAWKDLLLILQQHVQFLELVPDTRTFKTSDDILAVAQPEIPQFHEIHADQHGYGKLDKWRCEVNALIIARKLPNGKGFSMGKIRSSATFMLEVVQFVVDHMEVAEMTPVLVPLPGKQTFFHPRPSALLVAQQAINHVYGAGTEWRVGADTVVQNDVQRSFVKEKDLMFSRVRKAVNALSNVEKDFPWFWRMHYAVVDLSEALSEKFGIQKFVPQESSAPVIRDYSSWMNMPTPLQEPARLAHALNLVQMACARTALQAHKDAAHILAEWDLPEPSNLITYSKEIAAAIKKLEQQAKNNPEQYARIVRAETEWRNSLLALDNIVELDVEKTDKVDQA